MKIVAASDLHGNLPDIPECELLLLVGDLTPVENHGIHFQAEWLDTKFRSWLRYVPARQIIGIAGNHDFVFEQAPDLVPADLPWTYLQDSGTQWEGWNIWGTPWQPVFFDWAFNGTPAQLRRQWALIPDNTDILVVHGPPHGYGDQARKLSGNGWHQCGCPHLLERIQEIQPRLVVFGHIHEGRGQWQLDRTVLANVSLVDEAYRYVHKPWVMELDRHSDNSES
jgi:predicted phosphodiesterase